MIQRFIVINNPSAVPKPGHFIICNFQFNNSYLY